MEKLEKPHEFNDESRYERESENRLMPDDLWEGQQYVVRYKVPADPETFAHEFTVLITAEAEYDEGKIWVYFKFHNGREIEERGVPFDKTGFILDEDDFELGPIGYVAGAADVWDDRLVDAMNGDLPAPPESQEAVLVGSRPGH